MSAKGEATALLNAVGIDAICERIIAGDMLTQIARDLEIGVATLLGWIASDPERSQRARDARILSAQSLDEKAQELVLNAKDQFELQKAREVGVHLRWKASKIAPRDYGDKLQVDTNVNIISLSEEEIARRRAAIQAKLEGEQTPPAIEAPRE